MDLYLIFDLGGTSVKFAVSDKDGEFDSTGSFPTPKEGMERMLEEMGRVYETVQAELKAADSRIAGIAVSSPGAVDIRTGGRGDQCDPVYPWLPIYRSGQPPPERASGLY